MILSDTDIEFWTRPERDDNLRLEIDPMPEVLQPASVDLHLSSEFVVYKRDQVIDLEQIDLATYEGFDVPTYGGAIIMQPGVFVLGSTVERVRIPPTMVGVVEGKSSLARVGLSVHTTAGFIDPGFNGNITLELFNMNDADLRLYTGMKICQVSFSMLKSQATNPYGSEVLKSKYVGSDSEGTVPSRYDG